MPQSSWIAILAWHCVRYPLLLAEDIYKLTHQGVFGPGHMISSAAFARRGLRRELSELETRTPKLDGRTVRQGPLRPTSETAFEPLDPKGRLARVNLRPLAAGGGGMENCEWLVAVLVESAQLVEGDPILMRRRLAAAVRWCRRNMPGQAEGLERLSAEAGLSGYPAYHHSPAYRRAYRPAYRVVLMTCLRRHRASGRVC